MTLDPFALYLHVPFCAQKCPYCDFNTYATPKVPETEYIEALIRDLRWYSTDPRFASRKIFSVFWGGGTPSLLSPQGVAAVHSEVGRLFGIESGAEITLEANPSTPSKERYLGYRDAGVNRVSFGVQSFSPERLKLLGRDHSGDDARRAVELCVEAGISNVSVDIIFGVADQTMDDLERDLQAASALPINHVSTYALTIEPGTPFFQRKERGLLRMPEDDLVASMLQYIPTSLASHGFTRYEISNYAREGARSHHNEAYWMGRDYLGIGAGAHSYVGRYEGGARRGGFRWSTLAQPTAYMKAAGTTKSVSWREELSLDSARFEFFYLGLRRAVGVSLADFAASFGSAARDLYEPVIIDLVREGFIERSGDQLTLSANGILVADSVYERFILGD